MVAVQHLDWPRCVNARDLGGTPTADGRSIRDRALIRTDHHAQLTPAGMDAVRAAGVSRIIDLRTPGECARLPNPFSSDADRYRNLPVQDPEYPTEDGATLPEVYAFMLDRNPELFAAVLAEVAGAPAGAVVVCCHAGKDRTGLVTALALSLAGVAPDLIGADYALSAERRREVALAQLAETDDPELRTFLRPRLFVRASYMVDTLTHLERRYGGAEAYLAKAGLTATEIALVRERLLA